MEERETAELIKETWLEVFPHGHAQIRQIMKSYSVILLLQNNWYNDIMQNDPLSYFMRIEGENAKEFKLHCLTRPPEGSNLVYQSIGMRKQTMKKVTREKLIKRFSKIKGWLKTLDLKHDILDLKHEEEQEEEMTEEDEFNMKADLDYDQMIDDSLTD